MMITEEHVGKRVRLPIWGDLAWVSVAFVGKRLFFGENKNGYEDCWYRDADWELVPEYDAVRCPDCSMEIGRRWDTGSCYIHSHSCGGAQ